MSKSHNSTATPPPEAPTEFYSPGKYEPQDTIGFIIKSVHVSLNKMIDIEMQKYDLTAMQWRPLLYLYYGKVTTAAALAKETCMDTGATTRMLDRLQNKGLIERKRCDQDRRVVHLALTEEGVRTSAKLPADLCKVMNWHLKGFTQDEVGTLTGLLNRMLVNGQIPTE
jgi:DNA-binding MarR family transcriptional regulator